LLIASDYKGIANWACAQLSDRGDFGTPRIAALRIGREWIMSGIKCKFVGYGLLSAVGVFTAVNFLNLAAARGDTITLNELTLVSGTLTANGYVWAVTGNLSNTGDVVVANYNNGVFTANNPASGWTIGAGVVQTPTGPDPNNTTGIVGLTGLDDGGTSVTSFTANGWSYTADLATQSITATYVGPPSYVPGPQTLPTLDFFDAFDTYSGAKTAGYVSNDVGENLNGTPDITPAGPSNEYAYGELFTPGLSSAPVPLPASFWGGALLMGVLASSKLLRKVPAV
jgi:hypothetical protein